MTAVKGTTRKKKRQYSRNGCRECKRRKLKCDEGKPECWQCAHLGKCCAYNQSIKFSDTRNVTLKTTDTPTHHRQYSIIDFEDHVDKDLSPMATDVSSTTTTTQQLAYPHISTGNAMTPPFQAQLLPHISPAEDRALIINEASTLANTIIESINLDLDGFMIDMTIPEFVNKKDLLDSFNLPEPHKTHLEIFYDKTSAWIMPLEQSLCNEILLHNAKSAPYLLAAMLSLATVDEERMRYISTCLKHLSAVFQDSSKILSNIEALILTVLLLAADSSSTNWRAHLRGAKDLFTRYIRFYTTPSLLLAKSWFAAIEIIAGLQNAGTGKAHELDSLLDVGLYGDNSDLGVEVGLLLPNGYNLFLGYSTEAIIMYREFIKLQDEMDSKDLLFQVSLIHSAKEFQVASENIFIEQSNPAHPDYSELKDKITLPWSCYGFKGNLVYSWFDLIHQLHVDALLLKLYNQFLMMDKSRNLCQGLVKSMLGMCFFYEDSEIMDPSDSRLLMLQGPMLICGLNCIDDEDKEKVDSYFRSLIRAGVRSASASFKKVHNAWSGHGQDDHTMELVPFA